MTISRALPRVVTGLAWTAAAVLAGFALLRLGRVTEHLPRLFAVESLTIWLLLPASGVLLVALVLRRRVLAVVAVMLVLTLLAWTAPDIRWWPREQDRGHGPTIRLVTANVLVRNGRTADVAATLGALRPDVLVILELSPALARALEDAPALAHLSHRLVDLHDGAGAFGSAILSRYPLADEDVGRFGGFPLLSATVGTPGRPTTLYAVHTLQPLAGLGVLQRQLDELGRRADATGGPLIMAGDFNATRQHRPFRQLLDHGLRDAHLQRGRGLARTWPMDKPGPPFALLDHVLVSEELVVRDVAEATIPGSDHGAVVAELRRR